MLATIVRRLLQTIVVMLVMSALVFAGIYMVGDPVSMLASPEATEAQRAQRCAHRWGWTCHCGGST